MATYIGYALESSEPLRWIEGGELPGERPGDDRRVTSAKAAHDVSRRLRAAFYIDGLILRSPDSVRVVLRLQDVAGDSLLARAGASGPSGSASLPRLGLQAVSALLPILLAPGRKVDVAALGERRMRPSM